jgi:hypothetical protein
MKKVKKIAKGYRLKPETHKMIREIQKCIRGSLDDSINLACKRLLKEIKEKNPDNINLIN